VVGHTPRNYKTTQNTQNKKTPPGPKNQNMCHKKTQKKKHKKTSPQKKSGKSRPNSRGLFGMFHRGSGSSIRRPCRGLLIYCIVWELSGGNGIKKKSLWSIKMVFRKVPAKTKMGDVTH